jgi:hypothetical protein
MKTAFSKQLFQNNFFKTAFLGASSHSSFLKWRSAVAMLTVMCGLGTANTTWAGVIFSNPITDTDPSAANPYTAGQTVDANLTVSGIGRGSGITASTALNRYSASGWNSGSLDVNDYFGFTLTPNLGFKINFESFVYTGQRSPTGPTSFSFRSDASGDNFTTDIGTPTATGTTIDLSAAAYQDVSSAITFRLYGWGASSAAGTFSVNDFTFNGTVSAVPEPTEWALIVFGALFGAVQLGRLYRRRLAAC